ncbi:hypothetical protein FHETE_1259 [Fusarium heterosporum]|uniref:Uncharacterized protein n=1 Tax=Fusarium heterosporum TaxID=42747 RepID=A0A8H5TZB7_FUSHE|nr:hypothetical protein FHETE_1259 [Fusarium heterosporum]
MVTTRSKAKAEAAVAAAQNSRDTPIRLDSSPPVQTPAAPTKRKRTRASDDSPIPCKITKTQHSHPEPPTWLSELIDEEADETFSRSDHEDNGEPLTIEEEYEEEPGFYVKSFGQDSFSKGWSETGVDSNLEYFQAYPHDRTSTLCESHFLKLVKSWYARRLPMVSEQLRNILKINMSPNPDFSDLALPINKDTWSIMTFEEFKSELVRKMKDAMHRMNEDRTRTFALTFSQYLCELGCMEGQVKCSRCALGDHSEDSADNCTDPAHPPCSSEQLERHTDLLLSIRHQHAANILHCGHDSPTLILGGESEDYVECDDCFYIQSAPERSDLRPLNIAVKIAGTRIPVEIAPSSMSVNSKLGHVSVGGLHIIVDNCGKLMIKFR